MTRKLIGSAKVELGAWSYEDYERIRELREVLPEKIAKAGALSDDEQIKYARYGGFRVCEALLKNSNFDLCLNALIALTDNENDTISLADYYYNADLKKWPTKDRYVDLLAKEIESRGDITPDVQLRMAKKTGWYAVQTALVKMGNKRVIEEFCKRDNIDFLMKEYNGETTWVSRDGVVFAKALAKQIKKRDDWPRWMIKKLAKSKNCLIKKAIENKTVRNVKALKTPSL